jgi:hypothetical protein
LDVEGEEGCNDFIALGSSLCTQCLKYVDAMLKMSYLSWSLEPHKAVVIVCKKTTTRLELELGTKACLNLQEVTTLGAGAWNQSLLEYAEEDNILGAGALNHKVSSTSKSCIL